MSLWMNEYEVGAAERLFDTPDTPNLYLAVRTLSALVLWTNDNSDGWPYWRKPSQAAQRLMTALTDAQSDYYRGGAPRDLTDAELRTAVRPVKAFLTRQGVEHELVIPRSVLS